MMGATAPASFTLVGVVVCLVLQGAVVADLTPSGRLGALDGARKAASLGGSIAAVCGEDFVAIATASAEAHRDLKTPRSYPPERLFRVDADLCVAAVGFARDAVLVAEAAREACVLHRVRHGTAPPVTRVAQHVADRMATAARQSRPVGVHVVVAGLMPSSQEPTLCVIEPTGYLQRVRACAVGGRHSADVANIITAALDDDDDNSEKEAAAAETPFDAEAAEALLRRALLQHAVLDRGRRKRALAAESSSGAAARGDDNPAADLPTDPLDFDFTLLRRRANAPSTVCAPVRTGSLRERARHLPFEGEPASCQPREE